MIKDTKKLLDELPKDDGELLRAIFKSISGKDEDNMPNSSIYLQNMIINNDADETKEESFKILTEHGSYKPEIKITLNQDFVIVDLIFNSALDPELNILYNHFNKYGEYITKIELENLQQKIFNMLTITPLIYEGKYFFVLVDPVFWCKQPSNNIVNNNNSIRLLYHNDSIQLKELPELDVDIQREEFERQFSEQENEKRKQIEEGWRENDLNESNEEIKK